MPSRKPERIESVSRTAWMRAWKDHIETPIVDPNADALTVVELGVIWSIERTQASRRAKDLVRSGKAEYVKKLTRDVNGSLRSTPAYRLAGPSKRVK